MIVRHIYTIRLEDRPISPPLFSPDPVVMRNPTPEDRDMLISLFPLSFEGTIDHRNGLMEEAEVEIDNYLTGKYGEPLFHLSQIALDSSRNCISAVLSTRWGRRKLPVIVLVMTDKRVQGRKIAGQLLWQVVSDMQRAGEREVSAVVTDGNVRSERLFARVGFQAVETITE